MTIELYCSVKGQAFAAYKYTVEKAADKIIRYGERPAARKEFEIDGEKIVVVEHFVGDADLWRVLTELALCAANREIDR